MPNLWLRYSWNAKKPFKPPHSEELLPSAKVTFLLATESASIDSPGPTWGEARGEILVSCPSSVKQWGCSLKCLPRLQLLHGKKMVSVAVVAKMVKLSFPVFPPPPKLHPVLCRTQRTYFTFLTPAELKPDNAHMQTRAKHQITSTKASESKSKSVNSATFSSHPTLLILPFKA